MRWYIASWAPPFHSILACTSLEASPPFLFAMITSAGREEVLGDFKTLSKVHGKLSEAARLGLFAACPRHPSEGDHLGVTSFSGIAIAG